ncbi:hypothetical protein Fcan01_15229 [Folsomia candida]|uniref:Transmembrane protein n=1 Tax=Folsomia candida TaxID=158441 RepID=A0A226E075_FOLCA|nr:hypothetical protein Fcan01_15229 [Folsomia candida]
MLQSETPSPPPPIDKVGHFSMLNFSTVSTTPPSITPTEQVQHYQPNFVRRCDSFDNINFRHNRDDEDDDNNEGAVLTAPTKLIATAPSSSTSRNPSKKRNATTRRSATDVELETFIKARIEGHVWTFVASVAIIVLFSLGVVIIAPNHPNVQYLIGWLFVVYFIVVGLFLAWTLRGAFADFEKLTEIQKRSGILPTNYAKLDGVGDDSVWTKCD